MSFRDSGSKPNQPLDRILAVLEEVNRLRRPATIAEIAERVGLPIPTAHRIVGQLLDRAILKRQPGTARILMGSRMLSLSSDTLKSAIVADVSHQILVRLAAEIGEHCHVGAMSEGSILYIDSAHSGRNHGLLFESGQKSPPHCTSSGKIWLAQLSPRELEEWLETTRLVPITARTIVDREAFIADIETVRSRAWASSDEELSEGVIGCAVPILTASGQLIAALGVSAPKARMSPASLEGLIPILRSTADEIGKALCNGAA